MINQINNKLVKVHCVVKIKLVKKLTHMLVVYVINNTLNNFVISDCLHHKWN